MKKPFKFRMNFSKHYCLDKCSYRADQEVRIGSSWCKDVCRCADDPARDNLNNTPNRDFNNQTSRRRSDIIMCHQILGRRKDGSVRMRINPNNKQSHEEN